MPDKLDKKEVWITEVELEEWEVNLEIWEIVERDFQKQLVKIRRIDNGRGTSKEV